MKYVKISNEHTLSKLCFGTEPLGGKDWGNIDLKEIEESIHFAIDKGINFFDTADIYGLGLCEKRLSKILGKKRHDLFIATKGGIAWRKVSGSRAETYLNSSPEYLNKAINNSMNRLKIEKIPIYFIHWPDPNIEIKATFEYLQKQKEAGNILYLGCSNFSIEQIQIAIKYAKVDFLQISLNVLNYPPPNDLLMLCKKNDIKIMAYNVLGSGLLTGKYSKISDFPKNDRRSRMKEVEIKKIFNKIQLINKQAEMQGKTLTQFSLENMFLSDKIDFIITGIKNLKQAKENFAISIS